MMMPHETCIVPSRFFRRIVCGTCDRRVYTVNLDTKMATFWPMYENSDKTPEFGDIVSGCENDDPNTIRTGEFFEFELALRESGVSFWIVWVEDGNGDDWALEPDCIELVEGCGR